jgi:hydrogenase-4 component B
MGVMPDWCGYMLVAIGVVSGVMGVLYALGQHELKKLLAYHSIENIGIIALGLGLGLLGRSYHQPFLAVLGFGGGLLHVLNHSLFKGLLFLAAGAVIHKTHTGEMDQMGGVAKTMPVTSRLFMVGALSICGLPPFNGFISEFIIYTGLFLGLFLLPLKGVIFCAGGIVALAFMGALALACFTKVYGTVFSGAPRTELPVTEGEGVSGWMLAPMCFLALLCILIGLAPQAVVPVMLSAGEYLAHAAFSPEDLQRVLTPLSLIVAVSFVMVFLVMVLAALRRTLLGDQPMPCRETWVCAFSQVTARFQYTSSSFARSIVELMRAPLRYRRHGGNVTGDFPSKAHMSSAVHDASEEVVFYPLLAKLTAFSRKIDDGRIRYTQMYLMYIFLFLIFLLAWKLR